jgi:hypothetical protein
MEKDEMLELCCEEDIPPIAACNMLVVFSVLEETIKRVKTMETSQRE